LLVIFPPAGFAGEAAAIQGPTDAAVVPVPRTAWFMVGIIQPGGEGRRN
jgi:hypothetical protein